MINLRCHFKPACTAIAFAFPSPQSPALDPLKLFIQFVAAKHEGRRAAVGTVVVVFGEVAVLEKRRNLIRR